MEVILGYLNGMSPVMKAFWATMFTWGMTAIGAGMVFFFKEINKKVLNIMLGFAAGVMIAASFWSLLAPAIEMAEEAGTPGYIPATIGFLIGGGFLWAVDKLLPHMHSGAAEPEGPKTSLQRSVLLVLAITLHNIPEGMAVGVAFGAAASGSSVATVSGAIALAIGIGLQNLPEGAAVSIPLRREGLSRSKSFLYGQASGVVEPIAGVIGAAMVMKMQSFLPYALSFAAGAMIYVVVEELIPEAQRGSDTDTSSIGVMMGFAVMMLMDVALG